MGVHQETHHQIGGKHYKCQKEEFFPAVALKIVLDDAAHGTRFEQSAALFSVSGKRNIFEVNIFVAAIAIVGDVFVG